MKRIVFFIITFISLDLTQAQDFEKYHDPMTSVSFVIADSLMELGKSNEAIQVLEELREVLSTDESLQAEISLRIAQIKIERGAFEEAKPLLDSLIPSFKSNSAISPIQISRAYRSLANIAGRQKGDHIETWNLNQKALSHLIGEKPEILSEKTKVYYGLGQSLFFRRQSLDSAILLFKKALNTYDLSKEENPFLRASIYREMGTTMLVQQEFKKSREYLKKSLAQIRNIEAKTRSERGIKYQVYSNLASWALRADRIDSALNWGYAAIETLEQTTNPPEFLLGQAYSNISGSLYMRGDFLEANKMADRALEIRLRTLGPDHPRLAFTYIQKGNILSAGLGQYEKAKEFFDAAYRINLKTYGENYGGNLNILINLTSVYNNLGLWSESLIYAEKGLEISRALFKTDNQQTALFYSIIGEIYDNLNNRQESLDHYKAAERILLEWSGPSSIPIADFNYSFAEFHFRNGDQDSSNDYLEKAKSIYESSDFKKTINYNQTLSSLARNAMQSANLGIASEFMRQAIQANLKITRPIATIEGVGLHDVLSEITHVRNIMQIAKIELLKYEATNEIKHLKKSLSLFKLTQESTESLLKSGVSDADVLNLLEITKSVASSGTRIAATLYESTEHKEYLNDVFQFMESSRGRLLKITSLKREALASSELPDELVSLDRQLGIDLAYYKSKLIATSNSQNQVNSATLEKRIFNIQQKKDSLLNLIEVRNDKFYALKYGQPLLTLNEVQSRLDSDQVILLYQIDQDELFTLVIESSVSTIHRAVLPKDYHDLVERFPEYLINQNRAEFEKTTLALGRILVAPVKEHIQKKSWIVIPEGKMWKLNFDLLKTHPDNYLIHDLSISYGMSVNLLFNQKAHQRAKKSILAFSFDSGDDESLNPGISRSSPFVNLPGTSTELNKISTLIDGEYLFGAQANEREFKERAADFSILHLALHGEVDDQNIDNSKLFFAPLSVDSLEDGYLHPFELYNMELNASLAVLSACNTGSGKISTGEGIMSLGRAFQYAGVNSLLLSQWEVSDVVAPKIMEEFYKNLKMGMSKDHALRQAKLTFIQSANNISSDPYYWGGFFILGDSKPIKLGNPFDYRLWVGVLIVFALIVFIRSTRSRKTRIL